MKDMARFKISEKWYLGGILILGAFLRFFNLNWDEGYFQHPDERNILAAASRVKFFSQLNPHFFAYNSFTIYLYKATAYLLSFLSGNTSFLTDWNKLDLIGRYWGASISFLSLIVLYHLSKKLFRQKRIALIITFLAALSPTTIQTAHYATTENFLIFFILLITYLSFIYLEKEDFKTLIILSATLGLALATKLSAITFVIPIILSLTAAHKNKLVILFIRILLVLSISITTFFLFSPYTFLDFQDFYTSMLYEGNVVIGKYLVPYTFQFYKTTPYLYQFLNLAWQINPLNLLLFSLGIIWGVKELFQRKIITRKTIIVFSWPLVYFAIVGGWYVKFLRYTLPIVPFILLIAGLVIDKVLSKNKVLFWFILLFNLFWTALFFSFYLHPHPRVQASLWIYKHILSGSTIVNEDWDDHLPFPIPQLPTNHYHLQSLDLYQPDSQTKINKITQTLSRSDYVVLSSRRVWGSLIHLPNIYPLTSCYYRLLLKNKLGYQLIRKFSSDLHIFGLNFPPNIVEETAQVYDHPQVMIFRNKGVTPDQFRQKLESCLPNNNPPSSSDKIQPFNKAVKFGQFLAIGIASFSWLLILLTRN